MLMHPDQLRADKIWVIICWFSSFWHHFDLVKQAKFATSGHFLENAMEEWPEPWHADVSWPPSELMKFWSWSVDFPFWHHFDLVKQANLGCLTIFFRMHGRNGLQFDMLMYPDYLFNCLHLGHGLLIFLILAGIWLSETSHICSFRHFLENA